MLSLVPVYSRVELSESRISVPLACSNTATVRQGTGDVKTEWPLRLCHDARSKQRYLLLSGKDGIFVDTPVSTFLSKIQ